MTFPFHPEAVEEFTQAIDYYENNEAGLGYDFSLEVNLAFQNIISFPSAWLVMEDDMRRCLVKRFPYGVIYTIEQDEIYILAIMHLRRHPDYWKSRH